MLRLEPYQAQFLYLHEHGISTVEQLMERQAQNQTKWRDRQHRQPLYAKRRYETDEKIKEVLAREIDQQTTALRELRKEETSVSKSQIRFPAFSRTYGSLRQKEHRNKRRL
ncbi:MAG: hypothetical protein V8T10_10295 [Merdibacter sp.]